LLDGLNIIHNKIQLLTLKAYYLWNLILFGRTVAAKFLLVLSVGFNKLLKLAMLAIGKNNLVLETF
jgi:hypothetical protein